MTGKEFTEHRHVIQNGFSNSSTGSHVPRVIAVTSGKGGVGKSNIVLNLAIALGKLGKKVLIMDTNLGLSNIDILSGLCPKYSFSHLFTGDKSIEDILVDGPGNVQILPAHAGPGSLRELTADRKLFLLGLFDDWRPEFDIFLIDTAPGISGEVLYFTTAASEKMIVITPEPTSISDAATLIKILHTDWAEKHFRILVNKVANDSEGMDAFLTLSKILDQSVGFLSLDYLGSVPFDPKIPDAVRLQKPLILAYPETPASCNFLELCEKLLEASMPPQNGGIRFFWKKFLNI